MIPNAALRPLDFLIGRWKTVGTHPHLPGVEVNGETSFEWMEGGAFLRMKSRMEDPRFPDGLAIFGSDDATGEYFLLYFDERGVSRKYDVSFENDVLRWARDTPEFSQRFTITADGDTKMSGAGQMSSEGGEWEPDLSLTYTLIA